MNRIKTLSAVNLKTPEFSHSLSAINLILGDNFAYKTARLEAVRWGLIGYVPALGKTNAATFQLSCGSQMQVQLTLTDGTTIARSLTSKKGTIKGEDFVEPASFTVPDVLMDTAEYLKLSDRERIKYVFRLVRLSDKWSGETIVQAVEAIEIEDTPDQQTTKKGLVEWISESDFERNEKDLSVQDWLETVLAELKDRTQKARAALQRMEKTTQGIVELRARDEDKASAANVNRQITDKIKERDSLVAKRQAIRSEQQAAAKNEEARTLLTRRLAEPDPAQTLVTTRKQADELESATENYESAAVKTAETFTRSRNELLNLRRDYDKAEKEIVILTKTYEQDLKQPKCPHCGTKGKKFRESIESQYSERRLAIESLISKLCDLIAKAEALDAKAEAKHKEAMAQDVAISKKRQILATVRAEIGRMENLVSIRAEWQKQLAAIPVTVPIKSDETDAEFDAVNKELSELQDRHNRYIAAAHEAKRQDEARQQLRSVDAEVKVLSVVTKTVEKLQAEMVAEAFASILKDANKFTAGILKSRLEYRDGEIGRFDGTSWVAHKSFSGTEQLVAYAGISVALCQASPIKIVLIDELGRMSMANKETFVKRLIALVEAGLIDQVIMVDVSTKSEWRLFEDVDFKIIEL